MLHRFLCFLLALLSLSLFAAGVEAEKLSFTQYHQPADVAAILQSWAAKYPQLVKVITIGKSTSGTEMLVLQIAASAKVGPAPDQRPAILVSANIEGVHLGGTEAALRLIEKLLSGFGSDSKLTALLEKRTVYVAPLLNPDVAQGYFNTVRWERLTSARPVDDDLDGRVDEDGPDDLNGDGMITMMRVKDPEGKWIPDPKEPRLMRLADPKKGERGIYTLYTEGIDNDGDGEYNEDPAGGVELNRNFPHDFDYDTKAGGRWPISEAESIALLKFMASRTNIAMVLNFSTENTVLNQQQTGQVRAGSDRVKVPRRFATFLGVEPDTEYSIKEIVEIIKGQNMFGGAEVTEDMVAMFFGLGPAMAIDRADQPLYEAVQKEFKDALKAAKIDYPEKRAKGVGKGSFIAFCYYQYGVPAFSLDGWAVPEPKKEPSNDALTPEKLKTMSTDDFVALGEEKIDAFLKEQGAPPQFNAAGLIKMVKSGQVTPAKMAEMMERMPKKPSAESEEHPDAYVLQWSDKAIQGGKGFIDWAPFQHPTLGPVEIGGFVPYLKITPPPPEIEKAIALPVDFYLGLMDRLPELAIKETKVENLGDDLYQVTVYLTNNGWLPTSTAQGRRALTAWPIRVKVLTEAGQTVFSGKPIESVPFIGGSGDTKKLEWTIRGRQGSAVTVKAGSPRLGSVETKLVLQ